MLAYHNGRYVPYASVQIAPGDGGFVQGTTVAEQLRTFQGRLYRLDEHLARLERSLRIVDVDPGLSRDAWRTIAETLVGVNHSRLEPGDDLGLSIFVTPGSYGGFTAGRQGEPTVCVATQPVAFSQFAALYSHGQPLIVSDVRQVPGDCWPAELKCRSRMHYYLADVAARRVDPHARAVLLDHAGDVCEASTANLVAYFDREGLVSPPREKILPGVSVAALAELAQQEQIRFAERPLRVDDLFRADEILLTSTSPCLVPVTRLDGRPIGAGQPGPIFRQLLAAWSRWVGVDIQAQAERFARR